MSIDEVIAQLESLREDAKDRMKHTDEPHSIYHDDYYALTVAINAVSMRYRGEEILKHEENKDE